MVEVVALEIVDGAGRGARAYERVDLVVDEDLDVRRDLEAVVLADHALAGRRIIRLANPREQHEAGVVERISAEQHDTGGLLEFLVRAPVGVGDSADLLRSEEHTSELQS